MKFCEVCDNLLYIKDIEIKDAEDDETNELTLYCKNCNFTTTQADPIVIDSQFNNESKYKQYLTPNIKYDPTLPRVNNITCKNSSCTKSAEQNNEVIYLKYDAKNMNYIYFCVHCEHFWQNERTN